MSRFRNLRDDVVLIEQDIEEKIGSLYVVGKKKLLTGKVIMTGPGKRLDNGNIRPMSVFTGDRVTWGEWAGQVCTLEGKEYLIIVEQDIMGVLEDE